MTIGEAINLTDDMRPNQIGREMKIRFLSDLDTLVYNEVMQKYEPDANTPETFAGYDADAADVNDTEMLVKPPHAMLYVWWLMMQIDQINAELDKYENSAALYNAEWKAYNRAYIREHRSPMPAHMCY